MANLLSYSRIILALIFVYLIQQDHLVYGVVVLTVATVTDMLDGYAARKLDQVSDFGATLDPIADRFLVFSVAVAVFIKYSNPLLNTIVILIIAREILIAIGYFALRKKVKIKVSKLGKVSTAFVFTAFVVTFVLPKLGVYLLLVATTLYITTAIGYVIEAWRKINEKN